MITERTTVNNMYFIGFITADSKSNKKPKFL